MTSLRRKNKSHKVPNVKLRPAAPSAISRRTTSHDSGFESEYEASFVDTCPRPFRGVVLCATGIDDKTAVFKQAIELGAQPLSDLTDKVTHVLAIEPGSAKYKCAIEYKLPIMHPSWITESYEDWLKGDDVDYEESVKIHRLPTFSGVVLCISGIEDEDTRIKINKLVTQEGGAYVKDITRPVRVTHLLCSSGISEGSEKVRYAQRFNSNGEADIRIVWEEWFWDSLKVKGCYDEEAYSISKPRPVPRSTPEPERVHLSSMADPIYPSQPPNVTEPPKDDTLYDGDEEGPLLAARLPVITMQAWEGMLRSRGFERRGSKFFASQGESRAKNKITSSPNSKIEARPLRRSATEVHDNYALKTKALSSFRRTDSFAPLSKDTLTQRQRQPQPFRRAATLLDVSSFIALETGSVIAHGKELPIASSSRLSIPPVDPVLDKVQEETSCDESGNKEKKPFSGITLRAVGEVWRTDVRDAVEKVGGRLVTEDSDEVVNYIVVRLVSGSKLYRDESDEQERPKYRTECWLERCLNEERICAADEHVLFMPLKIETPVPGAELVRLNYTGLNDEELCWVKRLSRVLGFAIPGAFSRHSTHLLCPSRSGVKFEKAQEWGVPVVDMTWLTDIAVAGVIASTSGRSKSSEGPALDKVPALPKHDIKGKGKSTHVEEDHDHPMANITNNIPVHSQAQKGKAQASSNHETLVPNGLLGLGSNGAVQQQLPEPERTQPAVIENPMPAPPDVAHNSSTPSVSRQMSLAELRKDMRTTHIPSSETPSPVKAPSKPPSPVKLDIKAAAGLLDSITSLVKRPSVEEDEAERKPKRARPTSRSTSTVAQVERPPPPAARLPSLPSAARHIFDPFPHDEASQLIGAAGTQDESMCVTYEDPAQRTERQRLMALMESKDENPEREVWEVDAAGQTQSSSRGKRRSQRKAPAKRRTRAS